MIQPYSVLKANQELKDQQIQKKHVWFVPFYNCIRHLVYGCFFPSILTKVCGAFLKLFPEHLEYSGFPRDPSRSLKDTLTRSCFGLYFAVYGLKFLYSYPNTKFYRREEDPETRFANRLWNFFVFIFLAVMGAWYNVPTEMIKSRPKVSTSHSKPQITSIMNSVFLTITVLNVGLKGSVVTSYFVYLSYAFLSNGLGDLLLYDFEKNAPIAMNSTYVWLVLVCFIILLDRSLHNIFASLGVAYLCQTTISATLDPRSKAKNLLSEASNHSFLFLSNYALIVALVEVFPLVRRACSNLSKVLLSEKNRRHLEAQSYASPFFFEALGLLFLLQFKLCCEKEVEETYSDLFRFISYGRKQILLTTILLSFAYFWGTALNYVERLVVQLYYQIVYASDPLVKSLEDKLVLKEKLQKYRLASIPVSFLIFSSINVFLNLLINVIFFFVLQFTITLLNEFQSGAPLPKNRYWS